MCVCVCVCVPFQHCRWNHSFHGPCSFIIISLLHHGLPFREPPWSHIYPTLVFCSTITIDIWLMYPNPCFGPFSLSWHNTTNMKSLYIVTCYSCPHHHPAMAYCLLLLIQFVSQSSYPTRNAISCIRYDQESTCT